MSRLLIIIIAFLHWQNNDIVITDIDINNRNIPSNFDKFKILQVSDLHNKEFGKNQNKLVNLTNKINPDIIVVTGDAIDSRKTNMDIAIGYLSQIAKIYPTYYVSGNHERRIKEYNRFEELLIQNNVKVLNNQYENIKIGNEEISLIGMKDISFIKSKDKRKEYLSTLKDIKKAVNNDFTILLSHRPEIIDIYSESKVDLVFTGHAHGGQIRLPFTDGLFAPNQGLLPRYTSGKFKKGNTEMIVSRGLGNSLFPFRIFNRPELIVATLNKD
ncbi:MAG: metallophosphoesterase [Romboutsia sp.]|nr:metallophosphoesterase [Romboutsia sp.]